MHDTLAKLLDTARFYARWFAIWAMHPRRSRGSPSERHAVLMVTGFPPDISGGAYRPASLARYAHRSGWKLTVVSLPVPVDVGDAGRRLRAYAGDDVQVLRTPDDPLNPSHRLVPRVDGGLVAALDMARAIRRAFGDALPGTVVASGPSFSTFVAGYLVSRAFGVRLVLEYRDEWTLCPFDFVEKSALNRRWEQRCLARAEQVFVMTDSQRLHLEASFPALVAGKCRVVANGWEPAIAGPARLQPLAADLDPQRLVLTFAGMLGGHTLTASFLQSLARVLDRRTDLRRRLVLRFVGKKASAAQRDLDAFGHEGVIESIDLVPQAEAAMMLRTSDAVMLFHDARFERYIPGKLYEYVASGAAILLLDDVGECRSIVQALGVGCAIETSDDVGLEAFLDSLWAARNATEVRSPHQVERVRAWLDVHTREHLAAAFFGGLGESPGSMRRGRRSRRRPVISVSA